MFSEKYKYKTYDAQPTIEHFIFNEDKLLLLLSMELE